MSADRTMTRSEFYRTTALIAKIAAQWTAEGVINMARGRGEQDAISGSPERFCTEIRGLLSDIEKTDAPASAIIGDQKDAAT